MKCERCNLVSASTLAVGDLEFRQMYVDGVSGNYIHSVNRSKFAGMWIIQEARLNRKIGGNSDAVPSKQETIPSDETSQAICAYPPPDASPLKFGSRELRFHP